MSTKTTQPARARITLPAIGGALLIAGSEAAL